MIKKFILILFIFLWASVGFAANYYVDCSLGTGSNNGTSAANAWQSLSDLASAGALSTGDDIYFKNSVTCTLAANTDKVVVDWAGTAEDRVVIGCYDSEGDFDCGSTPWVDGNRAIIDGDSNAYPGPGSITVAPWSESSIIGIGNNDNYDYITFQELKIQYSMGYGFRSNYGDYLEVDNCYFYRNFRQHILLSGGSGYGVNPGTISRNYLTEMGYPSYLIPPHGGSIVVSAGMYEGVEGTKNVTVEYNKLFKGRNEGIGISRKATDCIVQYNVVADIRTPQIYMDAVKRTKIRYNLVYQTSAYSFGETTFGIAIDNEELRAELFSSDNEIYGNFIAGLGRGIVLLCNIQKYAGLSASDCHIGTKIYNNTLVDNATNFYFDRTTADDSIEVINNISFHTASTGQVHTNVDSPLGVTANDNLYNTTDDAVPGGTMGTGAITGDPDLARSTSFFNQAQDTFDQSDFKQDSQAAAYNVGTNGLGVDYDEDYWGTNKDTNTPWDVGAHEWDGGAPSGDTSSLTGGSCTGCTMQ